MSFSDCLNNNDESPIFPFHYINNDEFVRINVFKEKPRNRVNLNIKSGFQLDNDEDTDFKPTPVEYIYI